MNVLQALITVLGNGFFPIVVCAILFWYVYKRDQQHKDEIQKRDEQHREELKELSKSIENNTLVIQKLVDKLDGD